MAQCAVVTDDYNVVINIIVADPSDPPPDGCYLVDTDGKYCDIGWVYDPSTGEFYPPIVTGPY